MSPSGRILTFQMAAALILRLHPAVLIGAYRAGRQ